MRILLSLLIVALLSSCATVTTRKEYKVKVYSYEPNVKAEVNDSIYILPAIVKVKRSKENLEIKLITDSLTRDFTVQPSFSPAFIYGNLIFTFLAPAGYVIDLTNQKRFYYGKKILINSYGNDTITPRHAKGFINYYSNTYPVKKKQVNLILSLPYANHFHVRPKDEATVIKGGFFGLAAGAEYFYKDSKYLSLKGAIATDFEVPFPAPVDHWGSYETVSAATITITDNFKFRRFSAGYGLHYTNYSWQIKKGEYHPPFDMPDDPEPYRDPVKKTNEAIGITINGSHQVSKNFFIGINYSPALYTIMPGAYFKYQHLINLELIWKISL